MPYRWLALIFIAFLLFPSVSPGATINFGLISFDILIPGDGALGVNVFNISNFTGDPATGGFALLPDFPITTSLTLNSLALTITTPGGSDILNLGSLEPGAYPSGNSLQFASNISINSVTLSALLSQNSFNVDGGRVETAESSTVLYQLLPSSGPSLEAGIDLGVLTLETADAIPEPGTWTLLITGLSILFWRGRRLRR